MSDLTRRNKQKFRYAVFLIYLFLIFLNQDLYRYSSDFFQPNTQYIILERGRFNVDDNVE